MSNNLHNEAGITAKELLAAIQSFNEEQFNQVPFEGSWTAGQVAEHVMKSCAAGEILYGKVKDTGRPADANVEETRKLFLNFDIKMKSPEFIVPSAGPHKKEPLLEELRKEWDVIVKAAAELDLTKTLLDLNIPELGEMTRLELINFLNVHTQRHIHQLKNIHAVITG